MILISKHIEIIECIIEIVRTRKVGIKTLIPPRRVKKENSIFLISSLLKNRE